MPGGFNSNVLFDGAALAAVTTYVISLIKPFLEKLPFLRPDSSVHDAAIRILNLVVNALTVVALNYQAGTFNPNNWLAYLMVAVGQAIGSQGLYSAISSTSGAAQTVKAAPPIAQPTGQNVRW